MYWRCSYFAGRFSIGLKKTTTLLFPYMYNYRNFFHRFFLLVRRNYKTTKITFIHFFAGLHMHAVAQDPAPVCVCRLLKTFPFPFFFVFKARPPLRKDVNPQITHKCIMCIYSGTLLKIQHTSLTHSLTRWLTPSVWPSGTL